MLDHTTKGVSDTTKVKYHWLFCYSGWGNRGLSGLRRSFDQLIVIHILSYGSNIPDYNLKNSCSWWAYHWKKVFVREVDWIQKRETWHQFRFQSKAIVDFSLATGMKEKLI